ncbi:hypothetical protein AGLY_014011 [Aphis glycines]|uniref:PiggyBac transposable element-derived protein domain-containing protein n=1 Tax=Aphis glycines TaxID=307491 RepID=A0A6G0T5H5_APHGL|nr:hypothetical protein AGLY_014011 [Aphis glycines]
MKFIITYLPYIPLGFDEIDEEKIVLNQDIAIMEGKLQNDSLFHKDDAEYKTGSDSCWVYPPTTVYIPYRYGLTEQLSILSQFYLKKGQFDPNFKWKSDTPFQPKVHQFDSIGLTLHVYIYSEELYLFFALLMLMARNKKLKILEYWSTNPLLHSHIFRKSMSQNRFQILLCCFHFCNNNNQIPNDCLFKIEMVLQDLINNFRSARVPFQNLFINENLVL